MSAHAALRRLLPLLSEASSARLTSARSMASPISARVFTGFSFSPFTGRVPSEPAAQAGLLQELNRQQNDGGEGKRRVVSLFESGNVTMTEANLCEYVKALTGLDRLNGSRLAATLHQGASAAAAASPYAQQYHAQPSASGSSSFAAVPMFGSQLGQARSDAAGANAELGSSDRPIYMRQADRSMRDQLWATFRAIVISILLIAGIGVLVDEKSGMAKPFMNSPQLKPQKISNTRFDDVKGMFYDLVTQTISHL